MSNKGIDHAVAISPAAWPQDVVKLLGQVEALLNAGQSRQALDQLRRAKSASPWATNAVGVCLLRNGDARAALDVFRGLAISGHLALRQDAPTVFKTNFATALLATNNIVGCLSTLKEIGDECHPAIDRLRTAIGRWEAGLSFWHRLNWYMGGEPSSTVELDFPAGDLT